MVGNGKEVDAADISGVFNGVYRQAAAVRLSCMTMDLSVIAIQAFGSSFNEERGIIGFVSEIIKQCYLNRMSAVSKP